MFKTATRRRPSAPDQNNVRTYYRRPWLDRLTGRYTVEWENAEGVQSLCVHNRFTDLEGHPPSLASLMRLPAVASSYLATRRHPILPEPVPLLVWDAIRYLERELEPGMRVLEVGSGNSTLWFLGRGCRVTSIEHSADWAGYVRAFVDDHLSEEARARLEYHVEEGEAAVDRIRATGDQSFDVILVDSANAHTYRPDCVVAARPKVRPGGLLVLDNSDHPNNWPALETMADHARIRFTGLAPMCPVVCQTSAWRM